MHWNISTLISLFATLIYAAIFLLVIRSRPLNRLRKIFAFYLLAMASWSISAFMSTSGLVSVLPWFRVMATSPIIMMLSLYFFIQTLFGIRPKLKTIMLIYGFVASGITLFTDIIVQHAYLNEAGELHYQLGTYFWTVATPGYLLMIFSVVELIRGYQSSLDANHRNRIRYLLIGILITMLASLINFTDLGKYPIDVGANGITAILIAFAILRHQLLDIRVFARVGLLYSIITLFFGLIYYSCISLLVLIFSQLLIEREVLIISFIVGAISAFLLSSIRNRAQIWIDRLFFREKYNASLMLQRLSQATASLMSLEEIASLVLEEIDQTLHIVSGAILIKATDHADFVVIAEHQSSQQKLTAFRDDHPIINWMKRNRGTLTKNDLMLNPVFKSLWGDERKELEDFQADMFIPLNAKGKFIGLLIVGPKLSTQPYSRDDQLVLSTLANQTAIAIENSLLYKELEETYVQTISALANAIDIRDTYTSGHSQKIASWAAMIARKLRLPPEEVRSIYWGGLLHDIGKIGIPDEILKKPAQLTAHEWETIKRHTTIGASLISSIKSISHVAPLVEFSHERYDGLGYPHGIKGTDIPVGARIISVVDSYSAMRDERPYKQSIDRQQAIKELKENAGTMYDPTIVETFLQVLDSTS